MSVEFSDEKIRNIQRVAESITNIDALVNYCSTMDEKDLYSVLSIILEQKKISHNIDTVWEFYVLIKKLNLRDKDDSIIGLLLKNLLSEKQLRLIGGSIENENELLRAHRELGAKSLKIILITMDKDKLTKLAEQLPFSHQAKCRDIVIDSIKESQEAKSITKENMQEILDSYQSKNVVIKFLKAFAFFKWFLSGYQNQTMKSLNELLARKKEGDKITKEEIEKSISSSDDKESWRRLKLFKSENNALKKISGTDDVIEQLKNKFKP